MERVFKLIKDTTGLNLNESHKKFISLYILKRIEKLETTLDEYINALKTDEEEFAIVIDEAAINETYFFRETPQFHFLQDEYLPEHKGENIIAWSAASSSGEESISIYSLLKSEGFQFTVYASDIDSTVLNFFRRGEYSSNSFRPDGKEFINLLSYAGVLEDKHFSLSEETKKALIIRETNLVTTPELPFPDNSINIIFIRNVFIYFDTPTRQSILKKMEKKLKEGGIILFSMNEIASITCPDTSRLVKDHSGHVYFFRKLKASENKEAVIEEIKNKPGLKKNDSSNSSDGTKNTPLPKSGTFVTEKKRESISSNMQMIFNLTKEELQKSVEEMAKKFFKAINEGQFNQATEILENYTFRAENSEYKLYFQGLLALEQEKQEDARNLFKKSALLNPEFWPALFQTGILFEKEGNEKDMTKYLTLCHKAIEDYIKEEKVCYNFIVEEFSPSYFLNLCKKRIEGSTLQK